MGIFNWLKKQDFLFSDYSFLKVDMHAHLVPGIDDGSKSREESFQLMDQLVDMGYEKIITTPHIHSDYYHNTPETIKAAFQELNDYSKLKIEYAAEYYVDEYFMGLLKEPEHLLTFSGNHILIEYSMHRETPLVDQSIFRLLASGIKPIIAHPERYLYYADQIDKLEKMKSSGCLLQVNLMSLSGYYGAPQQKLAYKLLDANLVDLLGTDLHRASQISALEDVFKSKRNQKIFEKQVFLNNKL